MPWRFSGEPRIFKNIEKLGIRCMIRYDYKGGLRIILKMVISFFNSLVVSLGLVVVSLGLKKNWDKGEKNKHRKDGKKLHNEMSSISKRRNQLDNSCSSQAWEQERKEQWAGLQ